MFHPYAGFRVRTKLLFDEIHSDLHTPINYEYSPIGIGADIYQFRSGGKNISMSSIVDRIENKLNEILEGKENLGKLLKECNKKYIFLILLFY